ncbi:HTH-type transcriptional regulator ImmR [Salinivirga cyanobacteriivorans]|uniref:HTH-type transcriptional regulator ImmR n=1 Tax=Salinivirga cyanobacteriivorans TaxID=1307839 RepID=A0A0S2HV16_9BACT|nr:helix-turn-helix transcriptional regulator [Salinivirga cyanobacteriivorans]ALO13852.1 HTH-type transcriptional regulator ImmR [Salinivirga cyanobacteriivorans]ALO13861.1 HTH-type transcriptional regulator ImmR [Salinivirga cyanobacteriivorans]
MIYTCKSFMVLIQQKSIVLLQKHNRLRIIYSLYDMSFGKTIATQRKKKGISQGQLAKMVGTISVTIGRYERNEIKPSIDIAVKIAEALEVSLDYLTGKTTFELDNSIIKRVVEIQNLPEEDKKHILYTLDGLLQNVRTKQAFSK